MGSAHVFTVGVEDYFQANEFERVVDRASWDSYPSRVERNTRVLLDVLERHGATATFFVLGWVAEKFPEIVRAIADGGHEIASQGWWHRKITSLTPQEFREDAYAARVILEQVSGVAVVGFRAPNFSIVPGYEWAFDVLLETGYRYDSSLFPIKRMNYGYPETPPIPHLIHRPVGDIMEFPLATTHIAGKRLPAAGGEYFRQFPYSITRRAFEEHTRASIPGVFYIRPWEIDTEQPRMPVSWFATMRHCRNISKSIGRLDRLLSEFRFTSIAKRLEEVGRPVLTAPTPFRRPGDPPRATAKR